jgi:hypothetical protein
MSYYDIWGLHNRSSRQLNVFVVCAERKHRLRDARGKRRLLWHELPPGGVGW